MKRVDFLSIAMAIAATALVFTPRTSGRSDEQAILISGITIPAGYGDWKLISIGHEAVDLNDNLRPAEP